MRGVRLQLRFHRSKKIPVLMKELDQVGFSFFYAFSRIGLLAGIICGLQELSIGKAVYRFRELEYSKIKSWLQNEEHTETIRFRNNLHFYVLEPAISFQLGDSLIDFLLRIRSVCHLQNRC